MKHLSPDHILRLYEDAKSLRSAYEDEWRKAAAYCLPGQYASWQTTGPTMSGNRASAARRVAYDSTGILSLRKYAAILERLATPAGQRWHNITASDETLRKKHRVRKYFDEVNSLLFKMRYHPRARFRIATSETYSALGVYGNGPLFIGERKRSALSPQAGIKYVPCQMKDIFFLVDDDGEVCVVFRRFWLNVRKFKMQFPDSSMPPAMAAEAEKPNPDENRYFEFVHYVAPRPDFDPQSLDQRRHAICGLYICVEGKTVVGDEHGYASIPYKIPRVASVAGDPYGYSPAMEALSAMGSASQIKKTNLKQGNKAVDPVLLAADDNALNGEVDLRPGAVNYGGIDRNGRMLIQPLQTGNFRVAEALLQDERRDIEDSFFVTLFQILTETPEMTATEVMERVAEKAALLSPTMGRLQSELLGPCIERELEIATELGTMPEMPPELIEAQGEYEIIYTSPLAKSMHAEDVSGFMRALEMAMGIANATQDPSPLDAFDFDTAMPEIADHMNVPARWMADPEKVAQKRAARSQQAEQAQLMQNAPALASAAKTMGDVGAAQ